MADNQSSIEAIATAVESEGLPWTAGQTELTGRPLEEQRRYLGLVVTPEERQRLAAEAQQLAAQESQMLAAGLLGAPTSVDWRNNGGNYVTPVKNQGGCGSCVSFCSCATIESAVRIKLKNPAFNIDLSEGFLQFCGGGSCGGWGLTSGLDFAKSTGVTDEACMPYQATDMNCNSSRCSDWQNRLTKISDYTGYATIDARKNALASQGPLLAGMAVYNDFFAYTSGVYVKTSNSTLAGYPCISLVGYDDTQQCWILKNSWGTNWGEGGFVRIRYNQPDLLLDTQWASYSVAVIVGPQWYGNLTITQSYASRDSQNAWAYFQGLGWRKIQTGSADGVTNMLALFAEAVTKGRPVTVVADGDFVYQAYLA
ncbi:MAG: C1 family peptidase [Chloroflexota bacterium]|nr:C1 family peptidase [Chloroflexota bacterium]